MPEKPQASITYLRISAYSYPALAGVSMGPVFITVIGQCMGNRDTEAADEYFKKLTKVTLLFSYLFGITLRMGVIGIAAAMVLDWVVRAVFFFRRQKSGKWKTFQVI